MDNLEILVLEDFEVHHHIIKRVLSKYSFIQNVKFTSSLDKAIDLFEREFFNAIITDYKLEGDVTGIDFLRILRDKGHKVPSIILTGVENEITYVEAKRHGCVAVVSKFGYYEDGSLDSALQELRIRAMYRTFEHKGGCYVQAKSNGKLIDIPVQEVIMLESTSFGGRKIYTETDCYNIDNYIKDYENSDLLRKWIGKASRSTLLNFAYVEHIDENYAFLKRNIHDIRKVKINNKQLIDAWEEYLLAERKICQ